MRISVIVPFYNTGEMIERTLNSLINQTYRNFELILINDGSTDRTLEIVKKKMGSSGCDYKIISQENKGVSAARNRGIEEALGDYIYFFDSDDILEKNTLEALMSRVQETNAEIVFCGFKYVDENLNFIKGYNYEYFDSIAIGKEVARYQISSKIFMTIWSGLYSKSLIENRKIFFNEKSAYGEDQEFVLKALYFSNKVASCNKELVSYVRHSGAAMNFFSNRRFDVVSCLENIKNILEAPDLELKEYIDANIFKEILYIFNSGIRVLNSEEAYVLIKEKIKEYSYYFKKNDFLSKKIKLQKYILQNLSRLYILLIKLEFYINKKSWC